MKTSNSPASLRYFSPCACYSVMLMLPTVERMRVQGPSGGGKIRNTVVRVPAALQVIAVERAAYLAS